MNKTVKALVIRPDGDVSVEEVGTDLESMNALVGGYLQAVTPHTGDWTWHAYVDEEGKWKNQPVNHPANLILTRIGWQGLAWGDFVVGTVVVLGTSGSNEANVPDAVLKVVEEIVREQEGAT